MTFKKTSNGDLFAIGKSHHVWIEPNKDIHFTETTEHDEQRFNLYDDADEFDFVEKFYPIWEQFFGGKDGS